MLVPIAKLIPMHEEVEDDDFSLALRRQAATPKQPELDVDSQLIWQMRRARYEEILKKTAERNWRE
jgi:hypothetical protein